MHKIVSAVLLCCAVVCVMGAKACDSSTAYGLSTKTAYDVASVIHVGADGIDATRKTGAITVNDEKDALTKLDAVAKLNGDYLVCINDFHTNKSTAESYTGCAQTFLNDVNDPAFLTIIAVKNGETQKRILTILTAVQQALQTTVAQLSNMPAETAK